MKLSLLMQPLNSLYTSIAIQNSLLRIYTKVFFLSLFLKISPMTDYTSLSSEQGDVQRILYDKFNIEDTCSFNLITTNLTNV